ncbi:MAG: thiamine pyrophosphate-dependent enzyme, partial [Geminicoccaceae bacterium]
LAWRAPTEIPGSLQLGRIMAWLRQRLPPETILTNGAGNYAIWANRHFAYRRPGTQLAPTSGSMGYGLPAAIAAKLRHPGRTVLCMAGDGCFQMTGQELATAVQHGAAVIVLLVDNGMYGTIRMHQEREHPGRVSGTQLQNPDFAALARAHGAFGARVETTEAFAPAFEEALAAGRPALLHLILDPEAITPRTTISALRAAHAGRRG